MMKPRKIDDLLLLRFRCAGEKGMTENAVYKDISGLVELNAEMLKGCCDGLAKAGLLTVRKRNKYSISQAGTERARSLVRSSGGIPWKRCLVTYCLGLSGLKKIDPDTVRVTLLGELCSIPDGATLTKAVDRFLLHHLQQPYAKDVGQGVIRRALGADGPGDRPQSLQSPQSIDLEGFVKVVTAAARRTPKGWVGNKVFISHVWRAIQDAGDFQEMTLDGFKGLLIRANQQRLLSLSRADLAPLLDQQERPCVPDRTHGCDVSFSDR